MMISGLVVFGLGLLKLICCSGTWSDPVKTLSESCSDNFGIIITTLMLLGGAVLAGFGVYRYKKMIELNRDCYQEYQEEYSAVAKLKEEDERRVKREEKKLVHLKEQRTLLYKKYRETLDLQNRFYSINIIYEKYRNLSSLCSLYEYLDSGRCSQLTGPTGAYNKLEEEIRLNLIILKLEDIASNLEQIKRNQQMLYWEMVESNRKIDSLVSDAKIISGKINFIADQSAIAAQNTEWAAQELNTIKWLELMKN